MRDTNSREQLGSKGQVKPDQNDALSGHGLSPLLRKSQDLQLDITRQNISMSREVLMVCIANITETSKSVRVRVHQLLSPDDSSEQWRQWHLKLISCGERLRENLNVDHMTIEGEQLALITTELHEIAADVVDLVRSLRGVVCSLRSAYEERQRMAESPEGASSDLSEERVVDEDGEYDSEGAYEGDDPTTEQFNYDQDEHDTKNEYIEDDPTLAQLSEWFMELDELEGTVELAQAKPRILTIADLVSRWSGPHVAVCERTESQGLGLYAAEAVSAVQAVLIPMINAWRELTSIPRMTASEVADAFHVTLRPEEQRDTCWEHILPTLEPYRQDISGLPPLMPIEVTEQPEQKVCFTLYAPEPSLKHCVNTWTTLAAELATIKPLLVHLGAELSIRSRSRKDTMEYACTLRLPGNCRAQLQVDATTTRLMQWSEVARAGEAWHQHNRDLVFVVTDDAKESEVRVVTSSARLLIPENRERLGVVLPRIAEAASSLGIHELYARPEKIEEEYAYLNSESEWHRQALESGEYPVSLIRYSRRPSGQRSDSLRGDLKDALTFASRWMQIGDEAQQLESAGPTVDMHIQVPLSCLEAQNGLSAIRRLAQVGEVEEIILPFLDGESSVQMIVAAGEVLSQMRAQWIKTEELDAGEQIRIMLVQRPHEPFARLVLSDDADGLWASVHIVLGEPELSISDFPHKELAQLARDLPGCISETVLSQQTLEVSELQQQLRAVGFDLCDDLVNQICQSQLEHADEPLSSRDVSRLLINYLVFSPTGCRMEAIKVDEPGVRLRIADPKQERFSRLLRKPS